MALAMFDCARVPTDKKCSVKITGERREVIQAAHDHLASTHGLTAGRELKGKVTQAVDEAPMKYGIWGTG